MSSPETVLQNNDTAIGADLYLSFELGDKRWKLTMSDSHRGAESVHRGRGRFERRSLDCIRARPRRVAGSMPDAKARSCYEAGRDGWWLHRWLLEQGIDSIVVDSSSIEVNRRAKRAKTDRLDGDKLLGLLRRYHGGERRVWSVLHEPTPQQEDARRTHREIARLTEGARRPYQSHRLTAGAAQPTPGPSSAGAIGRAGGATMVSRCHRTCVPRLSARVRGSPWSRSR